VPFTNGKDERFRLIANNPVDGARFFKFMVELFIKCVLGYGGNHLGLYSKTAGYYGTVEQQGRLTLHLHMLLWIENSLTPQEIRDKILDPMSDFQKNMVEYLESVCAGEFMTGTMEQVQYLIYAKQTNPEQTLPNLELPEPEQCNGDHIVTMKCKNCKKTQIWWEKFKSILDELLFRLNRHKCYSGCTDPKYGTCNAQFPRDLFLETSIDPATGALNMKKGEAWLNTFTPVLTYLMRCNTDVTSLLSGTAIKSVFAYITDYITKSSLKTHVMFEAFRLFLIAIHST
jgi:Helitron helicase-like domain at N-terminus